MTCGSTRKSGWWFTVEVGVLHLCSDPRFSVSFFLGLCQTHSYYLDYKNARPEYLKVSLEKLRTMESSTRLSIPAIHASQYPAGHLERCELGRRQPPLHCGQVYHLKQVVSGKQRPIVNIAVLPPRVRFRSDGVFFFIFSLASVFPVVFPHLFSGPAWG